MLPTPRLAPYLHPEGWEPPPPELLRDLAKEHGMSGSAMARLIGKSSRVWRYWCAEDTQQPIPYPHWIALLARLGYQVPTAQ